MGLTASLCAVLLAQAGGPAHALPPNTGGSRGTRLPINAVPQVTAPNGVAIKLLIREGEASADLAAAACTALDAQGGNCSDTEREQLEGGIAQFQANFSALPPGALAASRANLGWELLFPFSAAAEARLEFVSAVAAFPSSRFLARELAACALLLPLVLDGKFTFAAMRGGFVVGANNTWSYLRRPTPTEDVEYLETWESHAMMRYQPPERSIEDEEQALLATGAVPSMLVPLRDPFDLTATRIDTILLRSRGREWPASYVRTHRLRHDIQQLELLANLGHVPVATAEAAIAAYGYLLAHAARVEAPETPASEQMLSLTEDQWRLVFPFYNRRLYVHPCPAMPTPAVLLKGPATVLYSGGPPISSPAGGALATGGVLVIDQALSEPALAALREFAELSTIWFKEYGTYLGAMMWSGWANPLLAQIAAELRAAMPEVLCDLVLQYVWAFKYDPEAHHGIATHADEASVNVNLWITPDDDNLDAEAGGLVVFDATTAGTNLTASDYNHPKADSTAVDDLLRETGYRNVTVPHRQNRAVVFESMRLHHTQPFSFRPGIRSRRINLTFLFGHKGLQCPGRMNIAHQLFWPDAPSAAPPPG